MDSYDVFRQVIDQYVIGMANFVGHYPFAIKRNFRTYLSLFIWYSFGFIAIFTCFTTNKENALLCLFFFLFASQGFVKSYVVLTCSIKRKESMDFLGMVYKINKSNVENRRILSKCARWCLILAKLFTLLMFVAGFVCIFIPLTISVWKARFEPIFPPHIPFIPLDTLWGYSVHCAYFIVVIITGCAGTIANEVLLITQTMHIWAMHKILDQIVIGLNQATNSSQKEDVKTATWLHRRIRNIVLMHREIYLYVNELSQLNYPTLTHELYSDQWCLIILMYVLIVVKWKPGILLCLVVFTKLFIYCTMGTSAEILNDRLYKTLVSIDIVMLPESEKKLILFMIHHAQHPATFRAGLVELNMEKFMDVLKTTYSFTMGLLEFA